MANVKDPQKPLSANLSVDEILTSASAAKTGKPNPAVVQGKKGAPDAREERRDNSEFGFGFSLEAVYRRWLMERAAEENSRDEGPVKDSKSGFGDPEKDHDLLSADDIFTKGVLTAWDMLRADLKDPKMATLKVAEVTDHEAGKKYYLSGKALEQYQSRVSAESFLSTQGIAGSGRKLPDFKISTPAIVQSELISAIDKAAKLTGVPAALIGAMAGIESRFGDPKMMTSPTGAIGPWQQTGDYRDANWKKHGDFIAQHVTEAKVAMVGGLDKNEKRALAFNTESAALMTALAARDFAKSRGLDLNDKRTWGLVYAEHNAGAGSVDRLMRGQMVDPFIAKCNPAIFRGKDTPQEVLNGYNSKMMAYANTYEQIQDRALMAAAKPSADAAIAKASASSSAVVAKTSAPKGPEPVPT